MSTSADVCKLILLGNGSVGKSSIVRRFVDDGFQKVYVAPCGRLGAHAPVPDAKDATRTP